MKSLALKVLAGFVTTCVVLQGATVFAQSKCDAGKLKEYGKKIFCEAKIDSKAAKKGEVADSAKEQKCVDKFVVKCAKAESQGDCTTAIENCADLLTETDTCRDSPWDWSGNYGGTYTGDEDGFWVGTALADGSFSALANGPGCTMEGSGVLAGHGLGSFSATTVGTGACSDVTVTWDGEFSANQWGVFGSGTWSSSSGLSGTWDGGRN